MKTVMDAINWLKGGNLLCEFLGSGLEDCDWVLLECFLQSEDCADKVGDVCTGGVEFDSGFYRLICSYVSYIDTISELSHAQWIKGASLEEYQAADKEVLKMENKTVEVDGMVYEIGKHYLFSDSPSSVGAYDELKGVNIKASNYRFTSASGATWRHCNIAIGELGTITPAPVKLIDGEAYAISLHWDETTRVNGIYCDKENCFTLNGGEFVGVRNAVNITHLAPESK